MIRVTRHYRFSASHRLHAPQLGEEENRRTYGKCNYPFGHGHDYELAVSVRGPLDPRTGRVLDTRILDAAVREHILDAFDRRNLNAECDSFREVVPTSENLGVEIARRLKRNWPAAFAGGPRLEKIRISETARNIFVVSADEIE